MAAFESMIYIPFWLLHSVVKMIVFIFTHIYDAMKFMVTTESVRTNRNYY